MAFRAAFLVKHARPLTAGLSRTHCHSLPRRCFSHTPIPSAEKSYPLDSLVADVIDINQQLEANPPKRRTRKEDDEPGSVELPPIDKWLEYFPWTTETRARSSLMNSNTAKKLAEAYVPEGARDQIIVESFPGPGVLTRALLELPKERIKKLIVLEDSQRYNKFLKPLETVDPRVTVIPLSGYAWGTYDHISALGLFDDVYTVDWSRAHMQLKFISHIPSKVHGEQLVSQLFRSIPERQWLFKYGRVPLHLIMTQTLWERISAPPSSGHNTRCKLSVIAEATATFKYSVPPETLTPYNKNFHPIRARNAEAQDLVSVSIWPLVNQVIEQGTVDEWDYILRRLFVQKATALKSSLPQLAPGAKNILKKVTDPMLPPDQRLDPRTPPRAMNAQEWKILAKAFIDWPFKPDDLSIDNFQISPSKLESNRFI